LAACRRTFAAAFDWIVPGGGGFGGRVHCRAGVFLFRSGPQRGTLSPVEMAATRYAESGDVSIAYQVVTFEP